jgi:hypothetical protein
MEPVACCAAMHDEAARCAEVLHALDEAAFQPRNGVERDLIEDLKLHAAQPVPTAIARVRTRATADANRFFRS